MTSYFKQCAATRPNGERCMRAAQSGHSFCHSHRNCTPPDLSELDHFPGLDIYVDKNTAVPMCTHCGELITDAPQNYPIAMDHRILMLCDNCQALRNVFSPLHMDGSEKTLCLCSDCFSLWTKIEEKIILIIASHGTRSPPIQPCCIMTRLREDFAIDPMTTLLIINKLVKMGQLCENEQNDRL